LLYKYTLHWVPSRGLKKKHQGEWCLKIQKSRRKKERKKQVPYAETPDWQIRLFGQACFSWGGFWVTCQEVLGKHFLFSYFSWMQRRLCVPGREHIKRLARSYSLYATKAFKGRRLLTALGFNGTLLSLFPHSLSLYFSFFFLST